MTERVIDRLEAVEIDEQHSKRSRLSLATAYRPGELLSEQTAIGQARELVILRELLQFAGPLRNIGDVAERNHAAYQFAMAVIQALAIKR